MPLYHFNALDSQGKKRKGLLEAHSEKEAKDKLREQNLMIVKLSLKVNLTSRQNLRGDHLLTFTIQLFQMLNAGIPLYEALVAIEEQYRNEPYHRILLSLCEQIKSGTSLSDAMANFPESFGKLYRAMVSAGEAVGALDVVLERLSQLLAKQNKLKKQITTAMIYPGVLSAFSLLIIFLLLGFVVPSIEGIFADRQLNGFTQFVLNVSHFFRDYWWIYLPLMGLLLTYIVYQARSPKGRQWIECYFLKIPLIRTLMIQTAMARFCRTMGTMQQGGLTMIDSLHIAREVMHNIVLEDEVKKAENKIIEGSSLSAEFAKSKLIPMMVSRMLAVGEDSGSTVAMLHKIAEIYEEELEKTLDRLMTLAQPVILIAMGAMIGFIMLGILLPLTDVSAFSTS